MKKRSLHQTKKTVIFALISLLFITFPFGSVYGAQLTLAWDKPIDSGVAGYNIYCGISGTNFTSTPVQKINSADQTSCVISGIEEGKTYSIAATSRDANGKESAFSETITHKVISLSDIDNDLDGYTENQGDCNDADAKIHPGAIEVCGDGIDQDCNGSDLKCASPTELVLETGEIEIDHQWTFVALKKVFVAPVVVANPLSSNNAEPAVVRVRNVTPEGFEVRVQEWGYLDGIHEVETVSYMVMEAGNHTLSDGTMVEAGMFETNEFVSVTFDGVFVQKPVVVAGVSSFNGGEAVTGRIDRVLEDGFDYSLQEQELNTDGHTVETVSYIAWEPSSGKVDGLAYEVAKTSETVKETFTYSSFNQAFSGAPVCVADMQTMNGMDPANVRWRNKDQYGIEFKIAEENSLEAEIVHYPEVVGYILIDSVSDFILETGDVQINDKWAFIPLNQTFIDPVVVAKPMSSNGGDPAVIRIRNVNSEGFEIRVQEWDYLDGNHILETVSYMVMEAGTHKLPDGALVEAGTFDTNGPQSILLSLAGTFSKAPVVLAGVISNNEPDAVTGRIYNVTTTGFNFNLQEQESSKQVHATETIAYIAWEPSSGEVGGRTYEVSKTLNVIKNSFYGISFSSPFTTAPVFVADMQTRNGLETANIRMKDKDFQGVDVKVAEEMSKDKETNHVAEVVGYLAIE